MTCIIDQHFYCTYRCVVWPIWYFQFDMFNTRSHSGTHLLLEKVFVQWEPPLIFPKQLQTVFDLDVLCDSLMHWHTVTWWCRKLPPLCVSLSSYHWCENSPDENLHALHYWSTLLLYIYILPRIIRGKPHQL